MATPGTLYAGTSGFAYKEWKGPFYPETLSQAKMLGYYSSRLSSVEINYTFRQRPTDNVLTTWNTQTPDGFRFTLKANQGITHYKRLRDVKESVDEFLARARVLGDRLGCILFQLPPNLRFDPDLLEGFLVTLPEGTRAALETRHESWAAPEVAAALQAHDVAVCAAETDDHVLADFPVTATYAYLRLRKLEYTREEIAVWGKRVREVLDQGCDVYCYFKHEGGGEGPAYALTLQESAT